MPEQDFTVTGAALKRLMTFVGKAASAVHPHVPDTEGPDYSAFSPSLQSIEDGMSLTEAIATLDGASQLNTLQAESVGGYSQLLFNATRDNKVFVLFSIARVTPGTIALTALNRSFWVNSWINRVQVNFSDVVLTAWGATPSVFTLFLNGIPEEVVQGMSSDGSLVGYASLDLVAGPQNLLIGYDSGVEGTITKTSILLVTAGQF